MNVNVVKAFNLYQQLSPPAQCAKWDDTLEDICSTKGWLNDKGDMFTVVCGQTWDMLVKRKCARLMTVCNKNAAKCWYTYCTITIKKLIIS